MIKGIHAWFAQLSPRRDRFYPPPGPYSRLMPIDALRGLIMIVMALDHANSFIAHGMKEFEAWAFPFHNYHGNVLPKTSITIYNRNSLKSEYSHE